MSATMEQVEGPAAGRRGLAARLARRLPARPAERRPGRLARPSRATGAVLLLLTVLSFAQHPGKVTFDTKLDLALSPAAFLGRALHLWNPQSIFGELQNQAYGYLFPMGPFFVLTDAIGMPAWVAQRLWCALLLCGAFLGALLLARALGIGSEPARYVGALGYALAPRMLTEIGPLSVEMLPAVLLPWVLLPLVAVHRIGSPRRAAALSGLAVLGMGGTNAAMVLMALTLPVIWLLTRRWTGEHVRLVAWWCAAVLAATLWWIVPLLLLAGYSLPFLDYIESAENTTAPLSLFQVLRGTDHWVAYLAQGGEPWWPAGFLLIDEPVLMVATMLLAGLGLFGLARADLPQRRFLLLGMLTGLTLLTVGYAGPLGSPVAEPVQRLLDGPLAALRNVHKLDPVLRLCLAMGVVHAVSRPLPAWPGVAAAPRFASRVWRHGQLAVAALLVVVVAAPVWLFSLRPGPGWTDVPAYWREAAAWLGEQDRSSRTLMLPATGFGEYQWGRTVDEPLQALARSPWAVRNQIPLGSEGNTRFLDAVSDAISDGRGSPALADFLARAGVRYLLLRNDVARASGSLPPVAVMHQALAGSPGIVRVATFGPSGRAAPAAQLSRVDRDVAYPALEVYEINREVPLATLRPAAELVTVSGGPESVLPLLEQGLLGRDQPAVLAGDSNSAYTDRWVVTDGLRRRERNVGRVYGNLSHTLADTDPVRQQRRALDVLPFGGQGHQTVAQYAGVRAVTASSSAGYADALGETDPSKLPFAAVDGDSASMWQSSSFAGPVDEWLEVQFDTPRMLATVKIDFPQDLRIGWPVARIRITTDRGSIEHEVPELAGPHDYPVFGGPSTRVRVTVLAMRGGRTDGNVAIRELTVPGVNGSRMLRVPSDVNSSRPPVLAFTRGPQARAACVGAAGAGAQALRCDGSLARVGEEPAGVDRRFRLSTAALYTLTGTALPRLGQQSWHAGSGLAASVSSQLGGDPAVSVRMAFDGDPGTAWVADPTDQDPAVTLRWPGARSVDTIRFQASTLDFANPPLAFELRAADSGGTEQVRRVVAPAGDTSVSFEPLVTDNLRIAVQSVDRQPLASDGRRGQASAALAELRIPALDDLLPGTPEQLAGVGCGFGPPIEVDGKRYETLVIGSPADFAGYRRLQVQPCGELAAEGLPLQAGDHRIRTLPGGDYVVQDLVLQPFAPPLPPPPPPRAMQVLSWLATDRSVQVGEGADAYLVVPENANAGWVARLDGQALEPARVDGWQQAWLVPAGAGGSVTLEFEPDRLYRWGLLAGFALAALLVAAAVAPARRRTALAAPAPSRSWWTAAVAVLALLILLGGPVLILALLGCLILRRLWPGALPFVLVGAILVATAVGVAGRLAGYGQDWAFGPAAQAAVLVAVAAAVAAFLYPSKEPAS